MHKTDPLTVFLHTGPNMAWSHITDPEWTRARPGLGLPKPAPCLAPIRNPNLSSQNSTGPDIDEDMYKSHFQIKYLYLKCVLINYAYLLTAIMTLNYFQ